MNERWDGVKARVRNHAFRAWTALAVLAGFVYSFIYSPELLTWWKRETTGLIEAACGLLPYPWNDRVEATLGNFGLWVQITLAIVAFRVLVWLIMALLRPLWRRRGGSPQSRIR
jgi:hypothetical protein